MFFKTEKVVRLVQDTANAFASSSQSNVDCDLRENHEIKIATVEQLPSKDISLENIDVAENIVVNVDAKVIAKREYIDNAIVLKETLSFKKPSSDEEWDRFFLTASLISKRADYDSSRKKHFLKSMELTENA